MSELSCSVVIECGSTSEITSIIDFPLRIYNIGMLQGLALALQSKDLSALVTKNGIKLPTKLFSRALLNNGRINGYAVEARVYNAFERLQDFISHNNSRRVRIIAHWAREPDLDQKFG